MKADVRPQCESLRDLDENVVPLVASARHVLACGEPDVEARRFRRARLALDLLPDLGEHAAAGLEHLVGTTEAPPEEVVARDPLGCDHLPERRRTANAAEHRV